MRKTIDSLLMKNLDIIKKEIFKLKLIKTNHSQKLY